MFLKDMLLLAINKFHNKSFLSSNNAKQEYCTFAYPSTPGLTILWEFKFQ